MPVPDITLLDRDLRGKRLPGAVFCVSPQDVATIAALSDWTDSIPSPIFALVASLRGLGITLDEMCRLCEFELAAGPMLGECAMRFSTELEVGRRYRTEVLIHRIERKHSISMGIIDRLHFSVVIFHQPGNPVAEVDLVWLLPRGKE